MPQSRKRSGHHEHHKPASIPARQRTRGRTIWAILMAVFALVITFFAAGDNYVALGIAALAGAMAGYAIGRKMEREMKE